MGSSWAWLRKAKHPHQHKMPRRLDLTHSPQTCSRAALPFRLRSSPQGCAQDQCSEWSVRRSSPPEHATRPAREGSLPGGNSWDAGSLAAVGPCLCLESEEEEQQLQPAGNSTDGWGPLLPCPPLPSSVCDVKMGTGLAAPGCPIPTAHEPGLPPGRLCTSSR